MQGYIKLYRKTMCSTIWQDPYYLKLWMYCLMKASHKEHKQLVGNQLIMLQPGEFITGRIALSEELNKGMKPKMRQSEISWWRHLNNLETWGMLNIKKTNKYSVVSIVKWSEYQENEQQMNIKCTSNEHQMNTNKNVKNGKNEKEEEMLSLFENWWLIYPRKIDKKKALKSFKTAIKNHSIETILAGTEKYAQQVQKTDKKFIKHPTTFLNNESFIDGFEEVEEQPKVNYKPREETTGAISGFWGDEY